MSFSMTLVNIKTVQTELSPHRTAETDSLFVRKQQVKVVFEIDLTASDLKIEFLGSIP